MQLQTVSVHFWAFSMLGIGLGALLAYKIRAMRSTFVAAFQGPKESVVFSVKNSGMANILKDGCSRRERLDAPLYVFLTQQ